MRIYPAIDIIDGACVRLVQGDYSKKTEFASDPCEVAERWQVEGGEFIHIVDLDGAKSGKMPNFDLIVKIAKKLEIPIEIGGGIRNMECVEKYLECGVRRVIIGTSALSDPDFVKKAVERYGERIAVGIDAKDGMVAVNGWEEVSGTSATELAKKMEDIGVRTIIYTDIATDGMLNGPNFDAMQEMVKAVPVDVVASGGVSSAEDIAKLKGTGVSGVIVGKALYTNVVSLRDAIEAAR